MNDVTTSQITHIKTCLKCQSSSIRSFQVQTLSRLRGFVARVVASFHSSIIQVWQQLLHLDSDATRKMGLYKYWVTGVITRPSGVQYNPFLTGFFMFLRPNQLVPTYFFPHLVMQLKSSSISLETFMFLKSSGLYLGCELVSCVGVLHQLVGWEVGRLDTSR